VERLAADGLNLVSSNGVAAGQEVFHLHVHLVPRFAHRAGLRELFLHEPNVDLDRVYRQLVGDQP
jgi:histidine triad (HIT) family protein